MYSLTNRVIVPVPLIYGTVCGYIKSYSVIDVHIPNDHHDNWYSDG